MNAKQLPLRNLIRRPSRTIALTLLIMLMSFSLFGGSSVILSLQNGLNSLENRLGADIIVIPASAAARTSLDRLLLQGTTGYYYMKSDVADRIAELDGVDKISSQVFLASLRADCCSAVVQVIGFDPTTDFSILPWIAESHGRLPGLMDLVVGSKVNIEVGQSFRIYGTTCPVIGRLAETGTGLDTAVYCTVDTVRKLLEAAKGMGRDLKIQGDPADVVSAVYVKVRNGNSVEDVANRINIYIRKATAVRTRGMITDVSDSLHGVASVVTAVMVGVWVLTLAILSAALVLLVRERRKEFAALRMIGMSRHMLARMVLKESALLSLLGGALGVTVAALVILPFSGWMKVKLGLPFLLPAAPTLLLLALIAVLAVLAVGMIASAMTANRVSRVDIGVIFKEEAF